MLTINEAIKMQGVEFTYFFEDGDSIPAYVKKFDPESGKLTCYSLEPKTKRGWTPRPNKDTLPDGSFCVCGIRNLERSLKILSEIAKTGEQRPEPSKGLNLFVGCAFS
jgi:hypothetical protein